MNSLRVLESCRAKFGVVLTAALISATTFNYSAQAQGLVEGAGATGVAGSASQGAAGMGRGLGNLFGRAGNTVGRPNAQQSNAASTQSAPSPNTATAASAANTTMVYPLAGLAKHDAELIVAAYKGDTPAVRRALAAGAKVNVRDRAYTWTPLMWASQNGHLGTVRYLLQKGANVNAKSNDPYRFIMLRYGKSDFQSENFFRVRTNSMFGFNGGITPLMLAAAGGYPQTMRELLAKGAQANARAVIGITPLMCASASGYVPAVQLLLDRGARPSDKTEPGATPLLFAILGVNKGVVRALLNHGADATVVDRGVSLADLADTMGKMDPEAKEIARILRTAAARQKRLAKRNTSEKPVRYEQRPITEEKQFPKATDAKPFDDGVMILR